MTLREPTNMVSNVENKLIHRFFMQLHCTGSCVYFANAPHPTFSMVLYVVINSGRKKIIIALSCYGKKWACNNSDNMPM